VKVSAGSTRQNIDRIVDRAEQVSSREHQISVRCSDKPPNQANNDALYQQILEQVRAKDDISFKLLSLVPLISGAGISILIKTDIAWGLKCFVSLFGATVTFSIFRWELRNIGWCDWLLKQARRID